MSIRENFFPDRFRSAAQYYTTGRPYYPASLSRRVADLIGLDERGAVLDVGTGPGFLAIDFAAHAGRVTALDPSTEMLAVAAKNAERAAVKLSFVHGSSYDLGDHLGRFTLATFGRSFHWTDRQATLRTLDRLIEPGGAVGLFDDRFPTASQNAWHGAFQAVLGGYAEGDPAGPSRRLTPNHLEILLASPFGQLESVAVFERRITPLDHFVDRALSFGKIWHSGDEHTRETLANEVRAALQPYARADGAIEEIIEGRALIARRTHER